MDKTMTISYREYKDGKWCDNILTVEYPIKDKELEKILEKSGNFLRNENLTFKDMVMSPKLIVLILKTDPHFLKNKKCYDQIPTDDVDDYFGYARSIIEFCKENDSYNRWYGFKILRTKPNKKTAIRCAREKLFDSKLMPLYEKFSDEREIKELLINAIRENKYIGSCKHIKYQPFNILSKHVAEPEILEFFCRDFYRQLGLGHGIHSIDKIMDLISPFYETSTLVQCVFYTALQFPDATLKHYAKQRLLKVNHTILKNKILERVIKTLLDKRQIGEVVLLNKTYDNSLISKYSESYYNAIIDEVKDKFEKFRRDEQDVCYGLTPLGGFSDFTYQDYFDDLLLLGIIAKYTQDETVFDEIHSFILKYIHTNKYKGKYFEGDENVAKDILSDLKLNTLYGDRVSIFNKKNATLGRFNLHSNSGLYDNYTKTKMECLLDLYDDHHGDEREYYRLTLHNYFYDNYRWMLHYYRVDKNRMLKCIWGDTMLPPDHLLSDYPHDHQQSK